MVSCDGIDSSLSGIMYWVPTVVDQPGRSCVGHSGIAFSNACSSLQCGSTTVNTQYMIPDSQETMPSQLTMHAKGWETITVPAGRFAALRYYNIVDFRFTNASERTAALRQENIWFAPELGRWVVRESFGTFREDVGTEVKESSYRWELLDHSG